jgi:hypothetical protein
MRIIACELHFEGFHGGKRRLDVPLSMGNFVSPMLGVGSLKSMFALGRGNMWRKYCVDPIGTVGYYEESIRTNFGFVFPWNVLFKGWQSLVHEAPWLFIRMTSSLSLL